MRDTERNRRWAVSLNATRRRSKRSPEGIPGCPRLIGRYVEAPGLERSELAKALDDAKRNLAALIFPALDHIAGDAAALT